MGEYKQPRAINSVSVTLLLLFAAFIWVVISAWPALRLNAAIKSDLGDRLNPIWRANLRGEPERTRTFNDTKAQLTEKLKAMNINDPEFEIVITADKRVVRLEVKHKQTITLEGTKKTFTMRFNPAVETDASRVDW